MTDDIQEDATLNETGKAVNPGTEPGESGNSDDEIDNLEKAGSGSGVEQLADESDTDQESTESKSEMGGIGPVTIDKSGYQDSDKKTVPVPDLPTKSPYLKKRSVDEAQKPKISTRSVPARKARDTKASRVSARKQRGKKARKRKAARPPVITTARGKRAQRTKRLDSDHLFGYPRRKERESGS